MTIELKLETPLPLPFIVYPIVVMLSGTMRVVINTFSKTLSAIFVTAFPLNVGGIYNTSGNS